MATLLFRAASRPNFLNVGPGFGNGGVGNFFQVRPFAATEVTIGGNQDFGLAVDDAVAQGAAAKTRQRPTVLAYPDRAQASTARGVP